MSSQIMHHWTLNSLVGAFLDLFIAYVLLCASTVCFFACKFLGFFGLNLPTPFNGLSENPNNDFKNLLVDYPTDKISCVQFSVTRKFPFDSIFLKSVNNSVSSDRGDGDCYGFRALEGEASCSSKSDARKVLRNEKDDFGIGNERKREHEFDMKGKGVMNHRFRGSFRRRRKGSFDNGKHSWSSSSNWITCVDQQDDHQSPSSIDKERNGGLEGNSIVIGASNYEAETPMVVKSQDTDFQDFVFTESRNRNEAHESITLDDDDKDNTIMTLARELEEEQAARAALYIELEKERNAAASAADEAMAMILRLQAEKASIEMESRQYQRMIEEKSAYDAEEMNILKEILLRREREKHFLEKQVESYRQMIGIENETQDFTEDPDVMLHELSASMAKKMNSRWDEDVDFWKQGDLVKQLPEKTIPIVAEEQNLELYVGSASQESNDMEPEPHVYDVHVIDNEPKLSDESNEYKSQQPSVDDIDRGFLDKEKGQNRRCSEITSVLPPMSPRGVSLRRHSTSALDTEKTKIDTEIEWLGEKLRIVQEGRKKLNLSMDNRERETLQLQLLEDITNQLREIRLLTEPRRARHASLPLPSSKGLTKKKRCRSASAGLAKSS